MPGQNFDNTWKPGLRLPGRGAEVRWADPIAEGTAWDPLVKLEAVKTGYSGTDISYRQGQCIKCFFPQLCVGRH